MARFRLSRHAVALGLLGAARGLSAQTTAALDANLTHVEYESAGSTAALTLSPGVSLDRTAGSLVAAGTVSRFETGDWSVQLSASGSLFARAIGRTELELGASFDASAQPGAASTASGLGALRLHLLGEGRGAWLGGELGRADDGRLGRTVGFGDLGAWARLDPVTVVARIAPSAVGAGLRYTDAQAAGHYERDRFELAALLGLRDWTRPGSVATTAWGSLTGTYWLGEHLAVSAGGGRYPADLAQGFPGGSYVTFGVRLATRRPTTRQTVAQTVAHPLPSLAAPVAREFRLHPAGADRWTLEVRDPAAARIEVIGDFTDWEPVALQPTGDGRWQATFALTPGTHRLNLRVNGGAWGVPPGLPVLRDEFDGIVALLTVP